MYITNLNLISSDGSLPKLVNKSSIWCIMNYHNESRRPTLKRVLDLFRKIDITHMKITSQNIKTSLMNFKIIIIFILSKVLPFHFSKNKFS